MDNIVSWNMRGMNGPNKQKGVKAFCIRNKAGLVCMMVTKVQRCNFTKVASSFQEWEHSVNYEEHDRGRVWIMWKAAEFKVMVIESMEQAIHCEILHIFTNRCFALTTIYGSNDANERLLLWQFLINKSTSTLPWLIVGDFNHLLYADDRIGGAPVTL